MCARSASSSSLIRLSKALLDGGDDGGDNMRATKVWRGARLDGREPLPSEVGGVQWATG